MSGSPLPPEAPGAEAVVRALRAVGLGEISLGEALGLSRQGLDLLLDKSQGLIRFGKRDEAEALLVDLTRVDGRSPMPPFLLGALRASAGRHDDALEPYEEARRRAHRGGLRAVEERVALCRAHSFLMLGDAFQGHAALRVAAQSLDPRVQAEAKNLLAVLTPSSTELNP